MSSDFKSGPVQQALAEQGDQRGGPALMEKRGSGLRRIINETKVLDGYKDELKPVFKSTTSQFMTTIYSTQYGEKDQVGTKSGPSWDQVVTKQSPSSH